MKYGQVYFMLPIALAIASCASSGKPRLADTSTDTAYGNCDIDDELLKDKAAFKISNHMINVNENGNYERFELDENKTFRKAIWKEEAGVLTSETLIAEDTEAETDPTGITSAFKEIVAGLEAYDVARVDDDGRYVRDRDGNINYRKLKTLLLYFNGGLNRRQDMRWKACEQVPLMLKDGIFPVFMIWPTSFFRSYGDQIAYIRNGKRVGFRPLTAPFFVIRDLGRGIFQSPTDYLSEFSRLIETQRRETRDEFYKVAKNLDRDGSDRAGARFLFEQGNLVSAESNVLFQAPYGDKSGHGSARAFDIVQAALWPVRLVTNPFISSFGKTAWENMVRRTRTSVRRPIEYRHDCEIKDAAASNVVLSDDQLLDGTLLPCGTAPLPGGEISPNQLVNLVRKQKSEFPEGIGAFSRFFAMLETCIDEDQDKGSSRWKCHKYRASPEAREHLRRMDFTMIGHSMGGIVLNELLTSYPDLPYRNIVYMGAAASIRSTNRAIAPLLSRAEGDPCCSGPRFFNLMLHPLNEARELSLRGFAPTGSLLAWIDEMYNDPVDMEDRTVGQWKNLRAAKHVFPAEAQKRMLFRVFNRQGRDCRKNRPPHPTVHSDFNDTATTFWRPAFWGADTVRWGGEEAAARRRENTCPNLVKDG